MFDKCRNAMLPFAVEKLDYLELFHARSVVNLKDLVEAAC
jgi:hypothetical protein